MTSSSTKQIVRDIRLSPLQIHADQLDPDGRLIVSDDKNDKKAILDFIKAQLLLMAPLIDVSHQGKEDYVDRYGKEELFQYAQEGLLKLSAKPKCGVIVRYNLKENKLELWWKPSQKEKPNGGTGHVHFLQRESDGAWGAYKVQELDENRKKFHETEFKAAQKLTMAKAQFKLQRISRAHQKEQVETLFSFVPGEELYSFFPDDEENRLPRKKLQPWFYFEIVKNLIDAVIAFHKERFVHGDLNPANVLVFGSCVSLIDTSASFYLGKNDNVATEYMLGTPGFIDVFQLRLGRLILSEKFDEFALAWTCAYILDAIGDISDDVTFGRKFSLKTLSELSANQRIPDAYKKTCLEMLDNMSSVPQKRKPLQEVSKFFSDIHQTTLKDKNAFFHVCVLDVSEVYQEKKVDITLIERAAELGNEVVLMNVGGEGTQKEYDEIFKECAKQHLFGKKVIEFSDRNFSNMRKELQEIYKERARMQKMKYTLVTAQLLTVEDEHLCVDVVTPSVWSRFF